MDDLTTGESEALDSEDESRGSSSSDDGTDENIHMSTMVEESNEVESEDHVTVAETVPTLTRS